MVNPLIIFNAIKYQKADLIELHLDLDGRGWEEKEGNHHCWLPNDFRKMMSYLNNEKAVEGIMKKNYSREEINERKFQKALQVIERIAAMGVTNTEELPYYKIN